jgi:hypothetical protein
MHNHFLLKHEIHSTVNHQLQHAAWHQVWYIVTLMTICPLCSLTVIKSQHLEKQLWQHQKTFYSAMDLIKDAPVDAFVILNFQGKDNSLKKYIISTILSVPMPQWFQLVPQSKNSHIKTTMTSYILISRVKAPVK